MSIDVKTLKAERDTLKGALRELEGQQRELESQLKVLRQKEIRSKREIEALTTLIELGEGKPESEAATPNPG